MQIQYKKAFTNFGAHFKGYIFSYLISLAFFFFSFSGLVIADKNKILIQWDYKS